MKDTEYLYMSSYLRVREKALLSGADIDRIAEAPGTQEALRMISQNSDYDFSALARPEDYEQVVRAQLKKTFEAAYKLVKDQPELVEIVSCKYDYHNVKVALKAKYQDYAGELPFVSVTQVSPEEILKTAEKPDRKSALPEHIVQAVIKGSERFEQTKNPQMIDIELDKQMYGHMLELSEKLGLDFISGYVRKAIDYYNFKAFVRVKSMQKGTAFLAGCLIEGGDVSPGLLAANYAKTPGAIASAFLFKDYGGAVKTGMESFERTGNYSVLEKLLDNLLLEYAKGAKRVAFGPEVLFSYLIFRENEARQLRILVACKQNGISADTLKERLRDNYV